MRHEEFVILVHEVRAGKRIGEERDGEIVTVVDGETLTLVPDAPTGPYYLKQGEKIAIDERVGFREPGDEWKD